MRLRRVLATCAVSLAVSVSACGAIVPLEDDAVVDADLDAGDDAPDAAERIDDAGASDVSLLDALVDDSALAHDAETAIDAQPCVPSLGGELCNGIDDDCNDGADEDFSDLGAPCHVGIGACAATGLMVCSSDGTATTCSAVAGTPSPELCNGVDDDCDPGTADGAGDPLVGVACDGGDTDLCADGTRSCVAGVLGCSDPNVNNVELCNGADDDCNPETADGSGDPLVGVACDGGDADLCNEGVSSCASGTVTCGDISGNNVDLCGGGDEDCDPGTADGSMDPLVGVPCDGTDTDWCPEGIKLCSGGAIACNDTTSDNADLCNGTDDDCRPATPDGSGDYRVGIPCDGGDGDLCEEGVSSCASGTIACSDATGDIPEACDGVDNDCNPATADGSGDARVGIPCDGTDSDLCREGAKVCSGGSVSCNDYTGNAPDLCEGTDEDCNPATADGLDDDTIGTPCDGLDSDLCVEGTYVCSGGAPRCSDATGNDVETCNGMDDDCNGTPDDVSSVTHDCPSRAIDITGGGTWTQNLLVARDDTPMSCVSGDPPDNMREVFYQFSLFTEQVVYFDTFGSSFSSGGSVLEIRSGACSSIGSVVTGTCQLGSACGTLHNQLAVQLPVGTYCLVVGESMRNTTTASLMLRYTPGGRSGQQINWLATTSFSGDTSGATDLSGGTCGGSGARDVGYWLAACSSTGRSLVASTCSGATWDTVLRSYYGAGTGSPSLACVDDSCSRQSRLTVPLSSGAGLYWVIVDGFSAGAQGAFTLDISWL